MKNALKKLKEKIVNSKSSLKRLDKVKEIKQKEYIEKNGEKDITILTPNCVAGEIYNLLGLKFNSPTINCSFDRKKYFVNFCLHLDEYLKIPPIITDYIDGHPHMLLPSKKYGDISIRWPHDTDPNTVLDNWNRRKQRIIKDKIYIITSVAYLDDSDIDKLNSIKTKNTIIFSAVPKDKKNVFLVKKYAKKKKVGKYNVKKLNGLYEFLDFFDFVEFLTKDNN